MSTETVTTVLAGAASPALTDLATAKDELNLQASNTDHDRFITNAIARASQLIANYCNRVLVPEQVQDLIDVARPGFPWNPGKGYPQIRLSRWPVIGLASVTQTLEGGSTQALVQDTDFRLDAVNGLLMRIDPSSKSGLPWESRPTTVRYTAGYGTLVIETTTVPATPYKVTVQQAAAFGCDHVVTYANGMALSRVSSAPSLGQYSVAGGVYTFAAADAGTSVRIAYAVPDVPDDLADMCLRLVVARFKARGRDPMLMQRDTPDVGSERFWVGGTVGQDGPFTPEIVAALDTYRVPVLA